MKKRNKLAEARKRKSGVTCGLCHKEIDPHVVNLVPMHKRCRSSLEKRRSKYGKKDGK